MKYSNSNFSIISISITALLYTGYLNSGHAYDVNQPAIPKIFPNISDSPISLVGLPGVGVDFSSVNPIVAAVNITRSIPNFVARLGNFTFLQALLIKAAGAIFIGLGIILLTAFDLKEQKSHETNDVLPSSSYGSPPASSYGAPPPSSYGAPPSNSYGAPPSPPSSSYGAPPSPPSSSYGAPPSSSYGAPPSPPSSSYGAPSSLS